jgi:GNAT superfamily N-acetyltransferase
LYAFVRARQLEGTFPGDALTGVWPITAMRIGYGWGSLPEDAWPRGEEQLWPPSPEPPGLDALAKKYRIGRYQRVRTMQECKLALASYVPVMASFEITEKWFSAPGGEIAPLRPDDVSVRSHTVFLIGYDDRTAKFKFVNSWGMNWGDSGLGYIPYDTFEATWCEGWFMDLSSHELFSKPPSSIRERQWGIRELGGGVFHCREFVTPEDERIGWAFAVERMDSVEVEELFVRPQFRRQGYGGKLIRSLQEIAANCVGTMTIWISHADVCPEKFNILEKLIQPLNLSIHSSGMPWAPLVATPVVAPTSEQTLPPRVTSYPRPTNL